MKLVAGEGVEQVRVGEGGPIVDRGKDGTFNVPDAVGKYLKKSGDFGVAGLNFQDVQGFPCPTCGRENVFKDSCGGCGWSSQ